MQINVEVHNYMETLVGQFLAADKYTDQYSHEQLADLACLSLSQIRPVYIRYDVDFLSAISETRLIQLKKYAKDAVEAAELMIKNDRRKNRDKTGEIPVVISSARFDEALELEWYERPIRGHHEEK
ncbi:Late competence development protein ComFB [Vibrio aerogenes CECT 7868]|uniref:Late competence development protein ComFB n=1 Tax=Vibrio aerogenes CECT 7868 TaxID=1216006 RepID=A0A1M5ZLW6_9VIBR|nr:late competence development ComFB family protein [Vibrio aerogenes]SHI25152.1 Late competence development protein ComFB [Vibrio aerogenes CECT 7868]